MSYGGETGIRTLDTLSSIHAFQACAFSHSAISPSGKRLAEALWLQCKQAANREVPERYIAIQSHCSVLPERAPIRRTTRSRSVPRGLPQLLVFFQLLRQVVCDSHFADGVQLPFQPVNVVLFVAEDLLGEIARAFVARGHAELDAIIQALDRIVFEIEDRS